MANMKKDADQDSVQGWADYIIKALLHDILFLLSLPFLLVWRGALHVGAFLSNPANVVTLIRHGAAWGLLIWINSVFWSWCATQSPGQGPTFLEAEAALVMICVDITLLLYTLYEVISRL